MTDTPNWSLGDAEEVRMARVAAAPRPLRRQESRKGIFVLESRSLYASESSLFYASGHSNKRGAKPPDVTASIDPAPAVSTRSRQGSGWG